DAHVSFPLGGRQKRLPPELFARVVVTHVVSVARNAGDDGASDSVGEKSDAEQHQRLLPHAFGQIPKRSEQEGGARPGAQCKRRRILGRTLHVRHHALQLIKSRHVVEGVGGGGVTVLSRRAVVSLAGALGTADQRLAMLTLDGRGPDFFTTVRARLDGQIRRHVLLGKHGPLQPRRIQRPTAAAEGGAAAVFLPALDVVRRSTVRADDGAGAAFNYVQAIRTRLAFQYDRHGINLAFLIEIVRGVDQQEQNAQYEQNEQNGRGDQ